MTLKITATTITSLINNNMDYNNFTCKAATSTITTNIIIVSNNSNN